MARRNISLPDELDARVRSEGLNVSALAQQALVAELERRRRMALLDAWLDEMDATSGRPSKGAIAEAETWVSSAVPVEPRSGSGRRPTKQQRTGR